jgi:hypothetical protein
MPRHTVSGVLESFWVLSGEYGAAVAETEGQLGGRTPAVPKAIRNMERKD